MVAAIDMWTPDLPVFQTTASECVSAFSVKVTRSGHLLDPTVVLSFLTPCPSLAAAEEGGGLRAHLRLPRPSSPDSC